MQMVSLGDDLYEESKLIFWEKISVCHLNLPRAW